MNKEEEATGVDASDETRLREANRLFGVEGMDELQMLVRTFRDAVSILREWNAADSDEPNGRLADATMEAICAR